MAKPTKRAARKTAAASGGETHQTTNAAANTLTTNQGIPVSDNQNTLESGVRGPSLLEDFAFREKITHFDHERIPERIVHARGSAAHGYFEAARGASRFSKAAFLQAGKRTKVFTRFSTVAGGAGSVDTPRDVRGFAVKFYTEEGNFDLVGNNIPVFFIQDAIKFPDLVHAVKMGHGLNGPSLRQHAECGIQILCFLAQLFQSACNRGVFEAELRTIETIPGPGFDKGRFEENNRILHRRNAELELTVDFHVCRKQREVSCKGVIDVPTVKRASEAPRGTAPI